MENKLVYVVPLLDDDIKNDCLNTFWDSIYSVSKATDWFGRRKMLTTIFDKSAKELTLQNSYGAFYPTTLKFSIREFFEFKNNGSTPEMPCHIIILCAASCFRKFREQAKWIRYWYINQSDCKVSLILTGVDKLLNVDRTKPIMNQWFDTYSFFTIFGNNGNFPNKDNKYELYPYPFFDLLPFDWYTVGEDEKKIYILKDFYCDWGEAKNGYQELLSSVVNSLLASYDLRLTNTFY